MSRPITVTKTKSERICLNCKFEETSMRGGYEKWYHYKEVYICHKCRLKLIDNPKNNPINNPKRIIFKDRVIIIKKKDKARTGQCNFCKKRIGDEFIKKGNKKAKIQRTSIHHIVYDNDPLMATIELCNQCHTKLHWKHRKKED